MSKPFASLLPLLAAAALVLPPSGRAADQALKTLASVNVELPQDDVSLPPGPGLQTVSDNCQACHTPGMIMTQPALPKAGWEAEVHKMINVYKAPVAAEDVPTIVGYLTAVKGAH